MSHQIAKLLLEKAGTFLERTEAVRTAMKLGMPMNEIEEYLDWLEMVRRGCCPESEKPAQCVENPTEADDR